MKKLIAICLVALMCLSIFAACAPTDTESTEPQNNESIESTSKTEEPSESESESEDVAPAYDAEAAAEYVDSLYKGGNTVTAADYTVFGQVMIGLDKYTITWTVDNELVKAIEGNPYWTIDVDEKASEEHTYTLTGTITAPDGTTATVAYERTVPKYTLVSFEDYMAATEGTTVVIEGIVVAMNGKSVGNSRNHLFLADVDGKGGYYCYQLDNDPVAEGVQIGMTVSVTAVVTPYSGMQETKGGTFTIVDETIKEVPVLDITEQFTAGADLKNYVGLAVTVKGVEIGSQDLSKDTSQYLYFAIGEKTGYVRTYVTDFPTTLPIVVEGSNVSSPAKATIDADHAAHFGYKADVTGILILYSGNPYLIPMSTTPFTNYEEVVKTPAEKVEAEKEAITIPEFVTEDTVITLPTAPVYYDDVTITWAVDNEAFTIVDGNMEVALGDEQITLTLTATVTCGEETQTKTFEILVKAKAKGVYTGEHVDAPVAGTAYKFYLTAKDGKNYYFNGIKSGNYLQTSTNVADGVDVYLEAVLDGETVTDYRFYFDNAGVKTYIDLTDAGKANLVTENPIAVFNYVAETNNWVAKIGETDYYLGTYNDFNTIGASKTSYINAENTGVTQFPANFATAIAATYVPSNENAPVAGTAYKFYLTAKDGKDYYFNGIKSGNYLQTSTNIVEGVDVFVEAVLDGETVTGYRFYFDNAGVKTYIDLTDAGKANLVTENPIAVFNYVAETNNWVAKIGETDYYLGTYNDFNTIGASKTSYINAENTGVTQFPANFASVSVAPVGPSDVTAPEAETAYKFYLTAKDGKDYFFNGIKSGNYLQTTTDIHQAIDVFVEAVLDGETVTGYRFYFDNAGVKTYIDLTDAGKANLVTENPIAVFNYVAETNNWVAKIGETDYYLGTYNDFNTIGASKTSYINAENTGVTQFPAGFATVAVIEEDTHVCVFGEATCTAPATCECGATEGEALGHNIVEGACQNCGAKVVTVTEAAALEDGTLVLITATVSKITYNWSDSSKNMSVDITDGTTTLNAYKLGSKVGAGDVITVYGKVGSYKENKQIVEATAEVVTAHTCTEFTDATCEAAKACTLCGTTEGEALGHNYVDGVCDRCGAEKPASTTYKFSEYAAGEQYAANEVHKLDDDVTVTTTDAHFREEIRLYQSAANDYGPARNGIAVFAMTSAVKSLSINAGNGKPLAVYGSTDGENWTLITNIEATAEYTDYPVELGETAYTFIKLAAVSGQARVASITIELQ